MTGRAKKLLVLVCVATLVATVCWLAPDRVETIKGLTRKDVVKIRGAVREEAWKDVLRNLSWRSLQYLPGDFRATLKIDISIVNQLSTDGTVTVCTSTPSRPHEGGQY